MFFLIFHLIRTALIVLAGILLIRITHKYLDKIAPLNGRLNRRGFIWRYMLLSFTMFMFYSFIDKAIMDVVVLPAYWLLRSILFVGSIFAIPFYVSFLGRRFNDLAISNFWSIPWIYFIVFAQGYGVVSTTKFTFNLIIILVTLALCIMPTFSNDRFD